jgi:DMSO/TMAO reductase YedYZ molybdopterin-dependent catalytic subunit
VPRSLTRRKFVLGASASSLLAGCDSRPAQAFLHAMLRWNQRIEESIYSPARLAPELPQSAQSPDDAFPTYYISDDLPDVPDDGRLAVGGLIDHPVVLTLDQLRNLPSTSMRVRHHCVEGWSAVAQWQGVRVSEIAKLVEPDPRARYVEFRSFDSNYWSSWDLASAMHPQTLLAYGMNGHELTANHGAPLRVYSAVKLGYKMVKYLTEVSFLPEPTGGYWENQGYEWFAGV